MKKLLALMLALVMVLSLAACAGTNEEEATEAPVEEATEAPVEEATEAPVEEATEAPVEEEAAPEATVMTYEEFMAANIDDVVCIETYVQATRSWWDNTICVYAQGPDGGYFMYDMTCAEEDAAKLVPGTKIRVTGDKAEFDGEVEIMNATFEFVEGDAYIAEALPANDLLGTDELINHMNQFVSFEGLTVESVTYKNDEPGDDIYVTLSLDGNSYDFCVEVYLTGTDSEVYTTVGNLKAGDVVNVEGFLYWYQGANPHITSISVVA